MGKKCSKNSGHKMHVCIYCKKEFSRLAEHFVRRHRNEDKVKDIIATTDKQARMWKWKTLRQQGDHFFNVMENLGERKLVKVPTRASSNSKYFNCPVCFARLRTCSKFEHKLVCKNVFQNNGDADAKEIDKDIFVRMPESLINKIRKSSYVHGFLRQTFDAGETDRNFRNTCKDIIYLEDEMKKITGENKPLSCFLKTAHVDDIIKTIKDIGGQIKYGKDKAIMRFPFRIQRFCRMLTRFSRYLTAYYSKRNLDPDLADITKFLHAFEIDSEKLLRKQVRRSIRIKQLLTPRRLPKTSDIKMLVRKLKEETPKLMTALRIKRDRRTWRLLAENVLCRLTIFNRRRGGGVENMRISDYTRTEVRLKTVTEESTFDLSPEDREFLQNVRIVEILHKCDNLVPIYITKELQEPMDMLLEYRKYADDIHENNDYFFAAGKNSLTSIRGVKVLERYRQILPDRIKKYFTATTLRKHGATVAQVLDLTLQDKEEWAAHMGHSVQVHNKYYKMSEQVSAILKTGRILTALNEGSIKYYKGKKISEIPLKTKTDRIEEATASSASETSEEKTSPTSQVQDDVDGAEDPEPTSPSSDIGVRSGADELPSTTKQSTNQVSTTLEEGTPVTLILVCNTPFPDKSGRTYENLIPLTITPSINNEDSTCPDEISISISPLPDKNSKSYLNEAPVTTTSSPDLERESFTQQIEVQATTLPDDGVRTSGDETRVTFVLKCSTPFRDDSGRPYVNLIPVTIVLSPKNGDDQNPVTTTPSPGKKLGPHTNVIPITTTPSLDTDASSYTDQVGVSVTHCPYRDKTAVPTIHIPNRNEKSCTNETPVIITSSRSTVRSDGPPRNIQLVCARPSSDKIVKSDTNSIPVIMTASKNKGITSSGNQMTGPTTPPDEVAKLNALRSSVIVSPSQNKGTDDITPLRNKPPPDPKNPASNAIAFPVITTPSPGQRKKSHSNENVIPIPDKTPVTATPLPEANSRSCVTDTPVTATPFQQKTKETEQDKGSESCTAVTPLTSLPNPEGNVRSHANEIPVITTPSPCKGVTSCKLQTPVTPSTSPDKREYLPDTNPTAITSSPDKDASSCNDINRKQKRRQEREESISSYRQQKPRRKETKSPGSYYDNDWKRMRRKHFEDVYVTRGKSSRARRVLVYDSDSDSASDEYRSLPVKKRLFKRYYSGNGSDESDESGDSIKVTGKIRKKRKRQSTTSKNPGTNTPTKKVKTKKPTVKVTLKLARKNSDEDFSDYSSDNSSDSSVFF